MRWGGPRGTLLGVGAAVSESPSPAEGPETGTGEHATHRAAEGQKERRLHSISLGTLHPWVPALHSDVLLDWT